MQIKQRQRVNKSVSNLCVHSHEFLNCFCFKWCFAALFDHEMKARPLLKVNKNGRTRGIVFQKLVKFPTSIVYSEKVDEAKIDQKAAER